MLALPIQGRSFRNPQHGNPVLGLGLHWPVCAGPPTAWCGSCGWRSRRVRRAARAAPSRPAARPPPPPRRPRPPEPPQPPQRWCHLNNNQPGLEHAATITKALHSLILISLSVGHCWPFPPWFQLKIRVEYPTWMLSWITYGIFSLFYFTIL